MRLAKKLMKEAVKNYIDEIKKNSKCASCGTKSKLEFHHIDPLTKKFNIGDCEGIPLNEVIEEIKKCVLLCGYHHDKLHKQERKAYSSGTVELR